MADNGSDCLGEDNSEANGDVGEAEVDDVDTKGLGGGARNIEAGADLTFESGTLLEAVSCEMIVIENLNEDEDG